MLNLGKRLMKLTFLTERKMKMKKWCPISLILIPFILTSCVSGIAPEKMAKHLTYRISDIGDPDSPIPVVFFLQGSDGTNRRANKWSSWFAGKGIASVMIDNAGVRGIKRMSGRSYGRDLSSALIAASKNPHLDLSRYAVMGFSRGGTAALESGAYLTSDQPKPDFIFALYPGAQGICPNRHDENTRVHVFYGELDDWGTFQGNRNACKAMADRNDNAVFHLIKNAHHGYDGNRNGKFTCCGGKTFRKISDKNAYVETQKIILAEIQKVWKLE